MQTDVAGVRVLITGSSSGFGYEMAKALLENGARVALTSLPEAKLEAAGEKLRLLGLEPLVMPMDVRDEGSIARAYETIQSAWGGLDVLVNNAGLGMGRVNPDFMERSMAFYEIDTLGFLDVVRTNFIGCFLVAKAFAPMMVRQKSGKIIHISACYSTMTARDQIPYGPAKAGAEALSVIMAKDLEGTGVKVHILSPGGPADTGLIPPGWEEEFRAYMDLLPADILNGPILYLASKNSPAANGERIIANAWREE